MGVAWPASLPQRFLDAGYSEEPGDNVLRSEMDVGPPKSRRRSTVAPKRITARMVMTKTQFASWKTYHEDTLADGTIAFDLEDANGTTREFFTLSYSASLLDHYYVVTLQLEYTP